MLEKKIKVTNSKGIHLKPATMIAQYCIKHPEIEIEIIKGKLSACGDSVMSILSLEINRGSNVTVKVNKNAPEALEHVVNVLAGNY